MGVAGISNQLGKKYTRIFLYNTEKKTEEAINYLKNFK